MRHFNLVRSLVFGRLGPVRFFFRKTKLGWQKKNWWRGRQVLRAEIGTGFLGRGQRASPPPARWSGERCGAGSGEYTGSTVWKVRRRENDLETKRIVTLHAIADYTKALFIARSDATQLVSGQSAVSR